MMGGYVPSDILVIFLAQRENGWVSNGMILRAASIQVNIKASDTSHVRVYTMLIKVPHELHLCFNFYNYV